MDKAGIRKMSKAKKEKEKEELEEEQEGSEAEEEEEEEEQEESSEAEEQKSKKEEEKGKKKVDFKKLKAEKAEKAAKEAKAEATREEYAFEVELGAGLKEFFNHDPGHLHSIRHLRLTKHLIEAGSSHFSLEKGEPIAAMSLARAILDRLMYGMSYGEELDGLIDSF